uniref:Ig-like domain-containing protein n=1 Tax=Anopheles quadriannulatus TaxID=34691 RepID=A0A182XCI2_ANOQN
MQEEERRAEKLHITSECSANALAYGGPHANSHFMRIDGTHVFSVEGVEGRSVELHCPITVPLSQVYMVLWFKDNAGIPLYSVDVRDKISRQPAHWSAPEVFGSRAKFNIDKSPASLLIKRHFWATLPPDHGPHVYIPSELPL